MAGDSCKLAATPASLLTASDHVIAVSALAATCLPGGDRDEMCGINGNNNSGGSEGRTPVIVLVLIVAATATFNRDVCHEA